MNRDRLLVLIGVSLLGIVGCAQPAATNAASASTGSGGGSTTSGTGGGGGASASVGQTGSGGAQPCGTALDGEGCPCKPGAEQKCFPGAAAQAGIGTCTWGKQTCLKATSELQTSKWSPCVGAGSPSPEVCDGIDNDCDGKADEGCACAPPMVTIGGLDMPLACGASKGVATLTFDQAVTGVVAGDTVTISGSAKIDMITGGPTVYSVALSGLAVPGPYTLDVIPKGAANAIKGKCQDPLPAPVSHDVTVAAGDVPVATFAGIVDPLGCGVNSTTVTVMFNEAVTGVVANDTVTATGGASVASVSGGPTIYTVKVTGLNPGGAYGLSVIPVGSFSKVVSACNIPMAVSAQASFVESTSGGGLLLNPGPLFDFGSIPLGTSKQRVFNVTPVGGATNVTGSVAPPFAFVGGAYPGVGGTCGAAILAPCTVVVEYKPATTCTQTSSLQLSYAGCGGQKSSSVSLSGSGILQGGLSTCATTNVLYVSPAGNDGNPGSASAAPKKTIASALAASQDGSEIRAAEGTYPEILTVSGCRKLFGGYSLDFGAHDPAVHVSALVASAAGSAVVTFPGAALHLDGFTVKNTAGTGMALSYSGGGSVITNNLLAGPEYGMYFFQHSCGAIQGNTIQGGTSALYFWQSQIPISNNHVISTDTAVTMWQNNGLQFVGNDVEGTNYGIRTWQEQGITYARNRISGATAAVDGWQSSGVAYRNNYVYSSTTGISESSDQVSIANNTIAGKTGVSVSSSLVTITNNLFLNLGGGGTGIGGSSTPSSIENNLFMGFATLYSGSGGSATTAAALNALNGTSIASLPAGCTFGMNCWEARIAGNVTTALAPVAVFASYTGPDGNLATIGDDDFHLITNDLTITQGGKDASLGNCGTLQSPTACGAVLDDFDAKARSAPYSIGAHQK